MRLFLLTVIFSSQAVFGENLDVITGIFIIRKLEKFSMPIFNKT